MSVTMLMVGSAIGAAVFAYLPAASWPRLLMIPVVASVFGLLANAAARALGCVAASAWLPYYIGAVPACVALSWTFFSTLR